MKRLLLSLAVVTSTLSAAPDDFVRQLEEAARVASIMIDGDLCQKIVTPRAMEFMFQTQPRDKWLASDNYDVDDAAFTAVKKTLIRISRLISFPADANLWMPVAGRPDKIRIVIRNANEMSQFWPWGALYQNMIPAMKKVLDSGRPLTVSEKPGWASVLAPVSNSLGDVVALVEVASQRSADAHANVK